jgi:hypothetical protein
MKTFMISPADKPETATLYYWCVFAGSLLVAIWCSYIDPVINPDGVKYVLAARYFLDGDIDNGLAAYKWPFYSLSIALVSIISRLPAELSALVFDAVMRGLAGIAFINLTHKFGATRVQLTLAVAAYLFYPGLNEVQSMIIRDFAYIACFMWMVVFFVQQISNPTRFNFMGFVLMGMFATAYRIEGLVYLVSLLVLYLVWGTVNKLSRKVGISLVVIVLPVMVYGVLMWIYDGNVGNAMAILGNMVSLMEEDLESFITAMQPGFLQDLLHRISVLVLIVMPIAKLLFNLLEVITIGYVIVLLAGWLVRPLLQGSQVTNTLMIRVWKWVIAINLVVLTGFVLIRQIVTDRYPLTFALMLIMFVPFAITRLYQLANARGRVAARTVTAALALVLLVNSAEGLDRVTTKRYLRDAGYWIAGQYGTYRNNKVYSNNRMVDYYAGKREVELDNYYSAHVVNALTMSARWKRLHFLAINLEAKGGPGFYRNFRYRIGKEPDIIFENPRGDKVLIYDFREESEKHY